MSSPRSLGGGSAAAAPRLPVGLGKSRAPRAPSPGPVLALIDGRLVAPRVWSEPHPQGSTAWPTVWFAEALGVRSPKIASTPEGAVLQLALELVRTHGDGATVRHIYGGRP